eukprot:TRINITY_DN9645_c3_g1_i1.p1 TRINITY_DN9645_c3_g1~~TRINITY_DN9645_c3_g1_i1.p1  ORF type:complete len:139 (+),score=28.16 TRINITY_DN9645_c3_g1_i1:29-418(+)
MDDLLASPLDECLPATERYCASVEELVLDKGVAGRVLQRKWSDSQPSCPGGLLTQRNLEPLKMDRVLLQTKLPKRDPLGVSSPFGLSSSSHSSASDELQEQALLDPPRAPLKLAPLKRVHKPLPAASVK